jgi:hypothetical protein
MHYCGHPLSWLGRPCIAGRPNFLFGKNPRKSSLEVSEAGLSGWGSLYAPSTHSKSLFSEEKHPILRSMHQLSSLFTNFLFWTTCHPGGQLSYCMRGQLKEQSQTDCWSSRSDPQLQKRLKAGLWQRCGTVIV